MGKYLVTGACGGMGSAVVRMLSLLLLLNALPKRLQLFVIRKILE